MEFLLINSIALWSPSNMNRAYSTHIISSRISGLKSADTICTEPNGSLDADNKMIWTMGKGSLDANNTITSVLRNGSLDVSLMRVDGEITCSLKDKLDKSSKNLTVNTIRFYSNILTTRLNFSTMKSQYLKYKDIPERIIRDNE